MMGSVFGRLVGGVVTCAGLTGGAPANAELLFQTAWNERWSDSGLSFELSYQQSPPRGSIGDDVFIAPWLPEYVRLTSNSSYEWTFSASPEIAYLQAGIANGANDYWRLGYPNSISLSSGSCVLGAIQCHTPMQGDLALYAVNSSRLSTVSTLKVWMNPVVSVNGIDMRSGGMAFYNDVSPVPEPSSFGLLLVGLLAAATVARSR